MPATTFIGHFLGPGTHAARPAAAGLPNGTMYVCTTDNKIERVVSGAWVDYATLGGGGGGGPTELSYVEQTANTTISATTESGANTIVTAAAVSLSGSQRILVEFFAPVVIGGTTTGQNVSIVLFDGGSSIGIMALHQGYDMAQPCHAARFLTPSAGSHTYSIRGFRNAATSAVWAGVGGAGANMPAFVRVSTA